MVFLTDAWNEVAMGIQVTLVEDFESLLPYKAAWDRLVEVAPTSTIFQTFEWHQSWWETLGHRFRLFVLLATRDNHLVGIAPWMIAQRKSKLQRQRVINFIGSGSSDYCDFILDPAYPDILPSLCDWLHSHRYQWDVLHLSYIPGTSPLLLQIHTWFRAHHYYTDVGVMNNAPTRLLNNPEDDQKIPRKKSLRRHYNYFNRQGTLRCQVCRTSDEILPYLDELFRQHIARWSTTSFPSIFLDENQQAFYRMLVHTMASTGWLHVAVVLLDDIPLALHFGFVYRGRFVWYKPTFNIEYEKHSPGEVLIKYLFEEVLQAGLSEFDFTIGDESFKYRFANYTRQVCSFRTFRRTTDAITYRLMVTMAPYLRRSWRVKRLARWLMGSQRLAQWRSIR